MYSIIIADIAPMTPGDLTHLNWPRLLRDKPRYRVYQKTYHKTVNTCEDAYNRKTRKMLQFLLGSNMLKNYCITE